VTDTFDYLESRDDADALIAEFGAVASLRRTTNSGTTYAPTQTTADYATVAVKVDFTMRQMQGGNVLDTDERWLVAAGPLTALGVASILPRDGLVVGASVKPILDSKPLAPAGIVVMYDCHIRQ
jgi:hypothetical protein